MKKNLVVGLVCAVAVAVSFNAEAQSKKKAAAAEHGHAHEEKDGHKHNDEHEHEDSKGAKDSHAHDQVAPHGGTIVKVGKHSYNLEFVRDPDAGKFQVFVLDGHMEYADVGEKPFTLVAKINGSEEKLTLTPVGAKEGKGAREFEGSAEWIKKTKKFKGTIPEITLKGKTFTDVAMVFPKAAKAHAH